MGTAEPIEREGKAGGNEDAGGDGALENDLLFAAIGAAAHAGQQVKPLFFFVLAMAEPAHGNFETTLTIHPFTAGFQVNFQPRNRGRKNLLNDRQLPCLMGAELNQHQVKYAIYS
jgi:hypothetical protein